MPHRKVKVGGGAGMSRTARPFLISIPIVPVTIMIVVMMVVSVMIVVGPVVAGKSLCEVRILLHQQLR